MLRDALFQSSSATKAAPDELHDHRLERLAGFNPRARQKPRPTASSVRALVVTVLFQSSSATKAAPDGDESFAIGVLLVSILERDKSRARPGVGVVDCTVTAVSILERDKSRARPRGTPLAISVRARFNPRARQKPRPTCDAQPDRRSRAVSILERDKSRARRVEAYLQEYALSMFQSSSATKAAPDALGVIREKAGILCFNPRARQKPRPTRLTNRQPQSLRVSILERDKSRARLSRRPPAPTA